MKNVFLILLFVSISIQTQVASIEALASQFANGLEYHSYDVKTEEGINMDCLKATKISSNKFISVFHSSIEQKTSGYSALYLAEQQTTFLSGGWVKKSKLSDRGSQGYIYEIPELNSLLVLYELQNHEKGNTVAIRYYQTYDKLKVNNFLYEYQIQQMIDNINVRNIGTPNVQNLTLVVQQFNRHMNQYKLFIKFHYSPDGQKDLPGYGYVILNPLRDFLDDKGQWIGGCKEKYSDWKGNTDTLVQQAISRIHAYSKIGQRDIFTMLENGKLNKYYLYEVNMNPVFNWKDWRIILYSPQVNRAIQIPFDIGQDQDIANPHISLLSVDQKRYTFFVSFFLPSEGVRPDLRVKAGQMTAIITLNA